MAYIALVAGRDRLAELPVDAPLRDGSTDGWLTSADVRVGSGRCLVVMVSATFVVLGGLKSGRHSGR